MKLCMYTGHELSQSNFEDLFQFNFSIVNLCFLNRQNGCAYYICIAPSKLTTS